jgi:hypothetical protein
VLLAGGPVLKERKYLEKPLDVLVVAVSRQARVEVQTNCAWRTCALALDE